MAEQGPGVMLVFRRDTDLTEGQTPATSLPMQTSMFALRYTGAIKSKWSMISP
jgi:hypothetical protein